MVTKILLCAFICLVGVTAEMDREMVNRHCQTPPREGILDKDWAYSKGTPTGGWYLPLFAKTARSKNPSSNEVDQILHQSVSSHRDKKPFCPRISWTKENAIFSYDGNKVLVFDCTSVVDPFSLFKCTRNVTASTDKTTTEDKVSLFATSTDNQSYIFVLRCWDDGSRDWGILSTRKTLSESAKELILNEAQLIGFDRKEYYDIDYENCKNK